MSKTTITALHLQWFAILCIVVYRNGSGTVYYRLESMMKKIFSI